MQFTKTQLVFVVAIVLILLASIAGIKISNKPAGSIQLVINLPDTTNTTLSISNKPYKLTGLRQTLQLAPGYYTIHLTRPGYSDFDHAASVDSNQTTTINIAMARTTKPSLTDATKQVIASVPLPGVTIGTTQSFYDDTWLYAQIQSPGSDSASVVVRYDDLTKTWQTQLGPGTQFDSDSVNSLPDQVAAYLRQHNLIDQGAL